MAKKQTNKPQVDEHQLELLKVSLYEAVVQLNTLKSL